MRVLWLVLLALLIAAACATLARRPARPLCGPDRPPHLGGCDVLATEDHDAVP